MRLKFRQEPTSLQPGDRIAFDILNKTVAFFRDGQPIEFPNGDDKCVLTSILHAGHAREVTSLVADAAGLFYVPLPGTEPSRFRFEFIRSPL